MAINVRIAGQAGQGVQTTGNLLVNALAGIGLHVFSTQSYMSRIRGGLNWFDIRISDRDLFAGREDADILVALTLDALQALRQDVGHDGLILFDGDQAPGALCLPFTETAKQTAGSAMMANSVAAGAVFALLGYDVEGLCVFLAEAFEKKGGDVAESNAACARRGAALAAQAGARLEGPPPGRAPGYVCSGSQAIGLAAATAGVKFVTAYPMTPATAIFTFLADVADEYGIVVEQAEDEIAAVNMICGATYAGVPAMTTTSGGGFALMGEGLSLAGMMELPIFIVVAQRPGPATGMPTRTAQQDLKLVINAGHGEFPRAVYAPGSSEQAYEITRLALQTAHRFQTPVILLIDQFMADAQKNVPELDAALRPIDRHIIAEPPSDYVRYAVTPDGVSPRALPGSSAYVICDSDGHTEDGHLTEDLAAHVRLQDKRAAKQAGLIASALPPEWYGPDNAEHVLLAWGSTYGPCREAVDMLAQQGRSAAMAHFAQVWPIDAAGVRSTLRPDRREVTSVEGNATGQFAAVLRETGALPQHELMLRYDGLPFTGMEIAERLS